MLIVLLLLILLGAVHQVTIGKMAIVDAFFCVCATITTLGCGKKSLFSRTRRSFAVYWILFSTISLALFFLYVAELHIERRLRALLKRVLAFKMTHEDLEAQA